MFSVKFKIKDGRASLPRRSSGTGSQSSLRSALSSGRSNTDSLQRRKRHVRIITDRDKDIFEDAADGLTEFREERLEIHIERTSAGLGLSIAGGKGSTPYKGDDEGIFISRVTEGGPADLAGLRVGDKVLKVNGRNVENVDHYIAVEVLKACGAVLVLHVTREVTRLVGHPTFSEDGSFRQVNSPDLSQVSAGGKHIPSPLTLTDAPLQGQQQSVNTQHLTPNSAPAFGANIHTHLFQNGSVSPV